MNPSELPPIKPYPIRDDWCRTCATRVLRLIHEGPIRDDDPATARHEDTLVCEACDTPDPHITLNTLGLDWPRDDERREPLP